MGRKISWEENSIMDGENGRGLYWRCVSARCGDMRRRRAFRVPRGEGAGRVFSCACFCFGEKRYGGGKERGERAGVHNQQGVKTTVFHR